MNNWHRDDIEQTSRRLKTDGIAGLTEPEAALRLAHYGPNELTEKKTRTAWRIFFAQFSSTVVLVLLISTAISALLGDLKNALTIGAILLLNALLGFSQERRAEKALAALRKLAVPIVKVKREARVRHVSARDVVPGDIVALEAGGTVPADGRIIESANLRIQESALTGESVPADKQSGTVGTEDLPLAERSNMAYAGTAVVHGRGRMIVTETGMATELGRVARMIQSIAAETTPLQRRLNRVGTRLAIAAIGIVAVIFALGLLRGENLKLMLMTAVSIAVAAVPEGLPAIVTINLAFGAQRLLKRNALIRRLPAVETLGSVTVICTDKTGTLTENKMSVALLDIADHRIDLRNVTSDETVARATTGTRHALSLLLVGGALCNDSVLETDPSGPRAVGDPTETALALAAARFGFHKRELERAYPRAAEFPFDSSRKRMTTVHNIAANPFLPDPAPAASGVVFTKGAVDALLSVSDRVFSEGTVLKLDDAWRRRIHAAQNAMAQEGMRVIGVAFRFPTTGENGRPEQQRTEADLIFIGLIGMQDPLRSEVRDAIDTCFAAGIKPVMITGDHPLTAQAISKQLGFPENTAVTGPELDRLRPEEWTDVVEKTFVYARVSPEHKFNIVQALQDRGHVVAMTGDGINDAPALKKADIGIAMGIAGTDVAKEAADMVLLDDNFATIVTAVKEGRVIYENIRKFLRYLLTGNAGEIWLMFLAPLLGMPMPLLPVQILWMNLITDGIPALALGLEPAGRNVMKRGPISPRENIFGRGMGKQIFWYGLVVGLVPLAVGAWYWSRADPAWQTMIFTTLILLHVEMAFAFRSQQDSFFHLSLFSNKPLLAAVLVSIFLQLAVIYTPTLRSFFNTVPLSRKDLLVCALLSTSVFWLVEAEKWVRRKMS